MFVMQKRKGFIGKVLPYAIGAVFGFALALFFIGIQLRNLTGSATEATKFLYALGMLRRHFDGELDNSKLCHGAISGLLKATGDPYTVFLDEKDFKAIEEMRSGGFGGIGVVLANVIMRMLSFLYWMIHRGPKQGLKPGIKLLQLTANLFKICIWMKWLMLFVGKLVQK